MRALHPLHRLLGSAMSVLVFCWCMSGAVMMFAGNPHLDERVRLAKLRPLAVEADDGYPAELARALAAHERVSFTLEMLEGKATWRSGRGAVLASGLPLRPLDAARAEAQAAEFVGATPHAATRLERADQWTLGVGASAGSALWRVDLGDDARSVVYVREQTGRVVQHTTRAQRVLAWLGAIPHWIYPAMLRRDRELWRTSVLTLASVGMLASLSGLVVGLRVQLLRRRARRAIRDGYLRVHQWLGLTFGVTVCTWAFSGALSLAPFGWTQLGAHSAPYFAQLNAPVNEPPRLPRLADLVRACRAGGLDRALSLRNFAGELVVLCIGSDDERSVDLGDPALPVMQRLPATLFEQLAARSAPHDHATLELRDAADDYYYPTHLDPRFVSPYLRVSFSDAARTALYLDPRSGELLRMHTARTRLERWLYHGLHSLDFPWLYARPWLWYPAMLGAMLAGASLSGLGVLMATRRLVRRRARVPRARGTSAS